MNKIKELKQRALAGDLDALQELRQLGALSGNKSKYSMALVSYAQRRLWFIDRMDQSPAYNLPAALILEGNLNVEALEKAFRETIQRHEILRTSFVETDGIPYQKISDQFDFNLVVTDLSSSANQEATVSKFIEEEANCCFDLSKGPLMVCRLMKLQDEKHLLLFNMHHIISDGWSIGVLISELTLLYNSFCQGLASPLSPLKIQYKDYARRHEQLLKESSAERHKTYWVNKFSGELPFTELPSDQKRPLYKTFAGKLHEIEIDESLHNQIRKLVQQSSASLFMFVVSAVNLLLSKYTGKKDIIVGSPVSGREQKDLEDQIGFYVNTIPLRNDVDTSLSFRAFLERVKNNCIDAYDHQVYPFDLLVEDLNLERDTSRNPLFEIMVSLQELNADSFLFDGIKTSVIKPEITFSKMDLHFNFEESDEGMKLGLIYNPDVFSKSWIERLGNHFQQLLQNILNAPDKAMDSIEFITPGEKELILHEFNNTTCYYPKGKTITRLFEELVEKQPDQLAVVYQGKPLTYLQLNEKANTLACILKNEYHVKLDEPVVLLIDRSHELIISILAVLKAGGAYLPIDTAMPAGRIDTILKDVGARIILAEPDQEINKYAVSHIIQVTENLFENSANQSNLQSDKTSSNLAYILYTSGSTGTPKGSMIEEKSVIRLVRNTNYYDFTDTDRIFSTSSISFDATTLDIWGALLNGATLYLENTEDYLDPEKMARYFSDYRINLAVMPTGLFTRMVEADQQNQLNLFHYLKEVIVGGDKLPVTTANKFILRYQKVNLLNVYGPTENTTITTVFPVTREFFDDIPIGKPIANTTVYIFNLQGNLCPVGVPGELCTGGEGLSRGYVNRPDLDKKCFIENPFCKGERLYRTGDIAQWSEDGNVLFLGRTDDQLKIRGFRIETGEIENTAAKCEGITNAKVLVIQEEDQKQLALYYTASSEITEEKLKLHLGQSLPEYMVPRYFVQMDEFPLNQNGKVDLKALPKPVINPDQAGNFNAPVNQTEKALSRIFADVLNVKNIAMTDNFFSIGGHSLKAIRVVSAIHKELSVKVNLKEFFASPDIFSLARIVTERKRELLGAIPVVEKSDYYELSHAQKRLWVLDQIEKSKSTYNIPLAVTIYDQIDFEVLQSAFDEIVQRHESLRTFFTEIKGSPVQRIIDSQSIPVNVIDFSSENDPDTTASDYIITEANRPFILSQFPLVRLSVVKTAPEKQILFLNIHHIVCDGWSLNVMIDELFGSYRKKVNKDFGEVKMPVIQYKDYAYWLNNRITDPDSIADREYWMQKLGGEIIPLDIPTDFRRPAVKTYQGNSLYITFSKELKKNLDAFGIAQRSSLFMILVAALKVLLYRYTSKEDIIVGTPVAGRNHPDLEDQIGYYVNTLALRDQLNPQKSFAEFLTDVRDTATDSYLHQMYPFDKLVDELKLPRDTSRSPLFDVMIVLQNTDQAFRETFQHVEPFQIPMNISKFDLTFNFNDRGEELNLFIEYNTQLYQKERIEQIASHLLVLLQEVITNPAQSINSVNILSSEEKENLLLNFNDTKAAYPTDRNIVDLFEESVEKYPSNTAVVYNDKSLTYSELDALSDKIAGFVRKHGVIMPGQPVGVLVSPSENMIAVLLGILKTGGAYVPLDPEYPDERIGHILSESKLKLILTQASNESRVQGICNGILSDYTILNLDHLPEQPFRDQLYLNGSLTPDTTAYIIFTSGSTGKPKGCPITHRNLVRLFINDRSHFDFGPSDVWIMAHSYCFDFSVWEMYGTLLFGGKLIVPDRDKVRDISAFVKLVSDNHVTVLNQTPGAFYKFIDTALDVRKSLSLRYVIFGGDKLDPSKLGKWIQAYPAENVRLINMYGITETTIHVTYHRLTDQEIIDSDGSSNIGVPLPETKVYILDPARQLAPAGVYGEIYVAGTGLSKGYLNRPDLTAERFIPNPYNSNELMYKSGDVGRWLYDGTMEYLDRSDNQVQIRGFRVETAEIELKLRQHEGINDVVVVAVDKEGTKELAAYMVTESDLKINELKSFLTTSLPDYMIPSMFIQVDKIPLTNNGKLDKKALPPAIQNIATGAVFETPETRIEAELLDFWQEVLSAENISIHDNFFDIGGNSILLVKLHHTINERYPNVLELTDLFSKSNIAEQAAYISQKTGTVDEPIIKQVVQQSAKSNDIAVIGMASRIGNCETPEDFWEKLRQGVDFIGLMPTSRIPDIHNLAGLHDLDPDKLHFREYCYLPEVDKFDHGFFKLSPGEASLIAPGQRLFMETAYHALEDAGYGGNKLWGSPTGVFIGASDNLSEYSKFIEESENQDPNVLLVAQTPSILSSRLSYHLNLKGPALLVDTACSSGLVALHLACQSIREGKIDSALVGGTKLHLLPFDSGARIEIDSSDARAHSFDESANGTGGGEGVIAIFIKSLENALKDRDHVYAVIKGSAINQDGNSNGITAPDAEAQAEVIDQAWQNAGIDPRTVSFIETHGTATKLGDPIEIEGITKAFKRYTSEKGFCAIGAVKANVGHLDTVAGLAGLLKAVLSLKHKQLTPLVHFNAPNPNINFDGSAAYINKNLKNWESNGTPLRCGVSSFGLSGTNCHVVLEEAPAQESKILPVQENHLFTLSSRTKDGILEYALIIREYLSLHADVDPENLCYTLATGRGHYAHRLAILFETQDELIQKLSQVIDQDFPVVSEEGKFYQYSKIVAANKKEKAAGEITENDVRTISNNINAQIRENENDLNQRLAEAYTKGANVVWDEYFAPSLPSKISLPVYPFEKKRCWVQLKAKKTVDKSVTTSYGRNYDGIFLNNCMLDAPSVAVYSHTFNAENWLVNEHRVMGNPTLVGVSYLQMAYEAGKNHFNSEQLHFEDFYLLQPLTVGENEDLEALITVNKTQNDALEIDVQSRLSDNDWKKYARFKVSEIEENSANVIDIQAIKSRMVQSREITHDNENHQEEIVQVSNKWNCLNKIYWNENEHLAELTVPQEDEDMAAEFYLYPPLIDAALSFAIDEPGFLPYSFGAINLRKRAGNKVFSHVRKQSDSSSETRTFDVTLTDESGNIIVDFRNFTLKKAISGANLFHQLVWKPWPLKKSGQQKKTIPVVLYTQNCNQDLVSAFRTTNEVVVCEIVHDNFVEIFADIHPEKVIFLLPPTDLSGENDVEKLLQSSLYSAFNYAKQLSSNSLAKMELLFVGENVCEVTGNEPWLNSLNNAVAGLGQVIPQENPNIQCRFLDIDERTSASEIVEEVHDGFAESYYYRAIRTGERFIREIKPVRPDDKKPDKIVDGVYVVTGGTGGIGLELALFLARQANVKLALLSRSEFPVKDKWNEILKNQKDESLCRKILKIQEIERETSEIHCFATDVSNFDSIKTTFETIRNELGEIKGIIHAAGLPGEGFIFNKKPETFRKVIQAKIQGTINICRLIKDEKPDFFLMTSALTAIIPSSGQSDYTAANSFQDAWSSELNRSGINAMSINLTSWKETGMAFEHGVADDGIFKSISSITGITSIGKIIQNRINSVILGEPDFAFLDSTNGLPFYLDKNLPAKAKPTKMTDNKIEKRVLLKGRADGNYSEFEISIAQIWGTVLGYDEINISDNYYDLGGDSIHAIKINGLLEKSLKLKVTISDLFNNLTIEELAAFLATRSDDVEIETFDVIPVEKSGMYPVSSNQHLLYLLESNSDDKTINNIPDIWQFKGEIDIELFKNAFHQLIKRHDSLRTSFKLINDELFQVVNDEVDFSIPVFTMSEDEARKYYYNFDRPFDLSTAPLFRIEIIRLSPVRHLVLFNCNHIIIDALSIRLLMADLASFYNGVELKPLNIQFKEFSAWEKNILKSKLAKENKGYWLTQFKDEIPPNNIEPRYILPPNRSESAGGHIVALGETLYFEVKKYSAAKRLSIFNIILTATNLLIGKFSNTDDITIGVVESGRDKEEFSSLIGCFIKILPIRTFLDESMTIDEYLQVVSDTFAQGLKHKDANFGELVVELKNKGILKRNALFNVSLSYMNFETSENNVGNFQLESYYSEISMSTNNDLILFGIETSDNLYVNFKHKKSIWNQDDIEAFGKHFVRLVEIITTQGNLEIGQLELKNSDGTISVKEDKAPSEILLAQNSSFYPVSSAQRRLFILDQLSKDKLDYHLPEIWNIKGKLNINALIEAFGKLIERHEILRTTFDLVLDMPVQIVHEQAGFDIQVLKMTEDEAQAHIRGFVRPFDLSRTPLFRTEIVELSPENHLVLFDAHHIIMDAFSLEIMKRDIFSFYRDEIPEPPRIQYKDYAIWQNSSFIKTEANKQKDWWINQFRNEAPVINLPVDYPRIAGQSSEAGVFPFSIDEKLTAEIKKLSASQGISTFMVLFAVYQIVMQKYTRQEDIVIGVTTTGRGNDKLTDLLGMFVNNLPIRAFPKNDMPVGDFLKKVRTTVINAFANQDYPIDELVENLNIKRDLNRSPLFDIVFSYMNFEQTRIGNNEFQLENYKAETVLSSEYDLMLYGFEAEDKIYITVKYKQLLFKKESIERFAGHFTKTVDFITQCDKSSKIADVDFLLPEEKARLESFNRPFEKFSFKLDEILLLEASFAENQNKTALLCADRSLTYRELNERANQLANYLRKVHAVKFGDLIGIMLDRNESMIVAMLGILKSGAAYVGIDPAYPQQRIDYILNDCKAKILVTTSEIFHQEMMPGVRVVDINDPIIGSYSSNEPIKINTPRDLAYVIYTSGSTGLPKGVAITRKNLFVFLQWCANEFKSTAFDVVYANTSYCFDLSVFEIFYTLVAGKTIRILNSALDIPAWLKEDRRVLINTVPSLLAAIREDLDYIGLESVSAINLAGEQIPQTLIDNLDCDRIEVRNLYGPSEDTTYSTVYRFSNQNRKVLIGKPIFNTQIYITDTNLKLVPPRHSGEICIAGDGLAKGYLYKDELTNEKFIPNPFGKGKLYRTGDLGRWTDTGDLEYLGRIDRQVKIRGFRIELGEIETNIRRYPEIENAVVVACEKDGTKDIAAFFVSKSEIDLVHLKNYLGKLMPGYMIPLYFVRIDQIPLTPNGKIDVKALPVPETDSSRSLADAADEKLTPTEEILSSIWKVVLGISQLSRQDSFFDLGGHSLKALKLITQINRSLNSNFALSAIFEHPSVAQFADFINDSAGSHMQPLVPLPKADYYNVSHAQRRMWTFDRVEKNSIAYNIPVVYSLNSGVDVNALQEAFKALIRKYESLRTCFVEIDGEPKQVIRSEVDFAVDLVEVNDWETDSKALVRKAITTPFNLEKAPLLKVTLLKHRSGSEYILIINVHHIVLDEWSIDILAKHLTLFYDHYTGIKPIGDTQVFAPSPLQYKEFAYWQNNLIESSGEQRNFWLERFKEPAPVLDLPADYQRPKVRTFEGKTEAFTLSASMSDGLRKLSTGNNATLFITSLALLHVLFSRYSKQNDLVIGTPVANREHPDVQDQIGFFLNTLALRNQSDPTESFKSFLGKVRTNTLEAFNHQLYPFDLLIDELQLPRNQSRSPLFDVMLISQTPASNDEQSGSGLKMNPLEYEYPLSKFDLSVSYYDDGNSIRYYFEYNTGLYKQERIRKMFDHFTSLIDSVLKDEMQPVSRLNLISSEEQTALFDLSKGTDRALVNQSIVTLIENQVTENQDELTVVYKHRKLTYKDVNAKANQLAGLLIEKGVIPGDFIAVMIDRTEWSVISLLAILKTGAVYVPVDPNYPQNRISYILEDSNCKVLITSERSEKFGSFDQKQVVEIEDIEDLISHFSVENQDVQVTANSDANAYVIYTSGSTGQPKGVLGTHKCLLNMVEWQSEIIRGKLKTLQFAPHSFDVSIQEMLFSLSTAGTLFMIENDTRYKMSLIAEMIEKESIDLLTMPYSVLNLFIGEVENFGPLKSLKHLITSGEQPYLNESIRNLLKEYPDLQFHNQYGPSETHVVTSFTLNGKMNEMPVKIPIGRPISNTQILLLDKQMQLVPAGIPGDLYIGGFHVANGYLNRPDLTNERFIQNSFGEGKFYKSGDVARWGYDGQLEFLGRDDGQVKVRGFRIELGEIESCLLQYPEIKEAAVKLVGENDHKEMAAYFTTADKIDIISLKDFMATQLPAYMIPAYFVVLEAFPRTPSGKTDLRSLPLPDDHDNAFVSVYVEPEGETETIIAEVWQEILNRKKISVNDNFFEVGGNSIKAIQLMSKVQKRLGKKTYLNLIFEQPTIRKMAAIILETDERLKNLEPDYILINPEREQKIFFMPPGIGYSFAYQEYARYFDHYAICGLNFIESPHPEKAMADILIMLQTTGAFYLFGHSAGGNMAYDVALELQKRGRQVGGIVMLDSYRQLEVIDWSEDEYLNDAVLYIEQNHAEFLDEEIKDAALQKIVAYRRYLNARAETETVNCPIIQIEANDEITSFGQKISRTGWIQLTPYFEALEGFGGHLDMLKPVNLEKNAQLTNQVIMNLQNNKPLNTLHNVIQSPRSHQSLQSHQSPLND